MASEKRLIGVMVILLTCCLLLVNSCKGKSAEDKMIEKGLKLATGKDVTVNSEGGKIRISDKDSKTEIAETSTWPPDLSTEVPRFSGGKIVRVSKGHEQGDVWTFNIYFEAINGDDIKSYAGAMKSKGWQTELIQMGEKGGYLNGTKGTMGMNFGFDLEKKDGMLAVFNRP